MIKRLFIADTHGYYPDLSAFPNHEIVLMGDMMEHGSVAVYAQFEKWLCRLSQKKIHFVRGNHDSGQYGNLYNPNSIIMWDNLAKVFVGHTFKYPWAEAGKNDLLILLDSVCKTHSPHDFAQGLIGREQQTETLRMIGLYEAKQAPKHERVTICLHHDPFNSDTTLLLKDAGEFIANVAGLVNYVFYGHTHIDTVVDAHRCIDGTHFFACPAVQEPGAKTWEQVIYDNGNVEVNLMKV